MSLRLAVAAVAIVALAVGCGGDSRRDDVAAYIEDANAIQAQLRIPLAQAQSSYVDFSRGGADVAKVRPRLARATRTMRTFERRLSRLAPPAEAKRLHTLLLRLADAQLRLAQEIESVADFAPRFEQRLRPLRVAERRLRTDLAVAKTPDAQAAAIDRYSRGVAAVLKTLQPLEPPAPFAAMHATQIDALAKVQQGATALAETLRNDDVDALPARIRELANAARAGQSLAAQRANIAALKAYNGRIERLGRLASDVNRERARLQETLQ